MSKLVLTITVATILFSIGVRASPQQERLVWIFVTDSFGRPVANLSVSTVEWGKPTLTTSSGKAGVPVSGKTNVGDLIHLIISSRHYATVTGAPIGVRISAFNRPAAPIPISLRRLSASGTQRGPTTHRGAPMSIDGTDSFQRGMRAVRAQKFIEALGEFSKAYDSRREAYKTNSNSKTKKDFGDVNRELGLVLVALNRVSEGKEKLDEAVRLNPNDDDSKYLLGICELTTGDMQKAEKMFSDVMSSRIRTSDEIKWTSYFLLAQLYSIYGKLDDSTKLRATALEQISVRSFATNREISQLIQLISKAEADALTERTIPIYAFPSINLATIILHKAQLGLTEKFEGLYGPHTPMLLEHLFDAIPAFKEPEKRRIFNRLISTERRLLGHDHLFVGIPLLKFANFSGAINRIDDAEKYLVEAETIFEKSLGKSNYWTALARAGLGNVYAGKGKITQAKSYWQDSQEILCKPGDQMNMRMCAAVLEDISYYYKGQKNYAEAIPPLRQALDIEKSLWAGKDSEGTATILDTIDSLEKLYVLTGRASEIQSLKNEKQTIEGMGVEPKDDLWDYDLDLAVRLDGSRCRYMAFFSFVKYPKAKPLLEAALNASKYIDPRDADVIETKYRLAAIYYDEDRYDEAARLIKQALEANENVLQPDRKITAALINLQAAISKQQDNDKEAETGYQQAANTSSVITDDNRLDLAIYLFELARVQRDKRKHAEAEKNLGRALEIRETADTKLCRELDSVTILVELANVYVDTQRYVDADKAFQQALAAIGDCCLADHKLSASILGDYARCLRKMGREADAMKMEVHARALRVTK